MKIKIHVRCYASETEPVARPTERRRKIYLAEVHVRPFVRRILYEVTGRITNRWLVPMQSATLGAVVGVRLTGCAVRAGLSSNETEEFNLDSPT